MIRLKNKKRIYTLCSMAVVLSLGLTACGTQENKTNTNNTQTSTQQQKPTENTSSVNNNITNNTSNEVKNDAKSTNPKNDYVPKISKVQLAQGKKPTFSTAWKTSADGVFSACIEGKGQEAAEEGVGKIFVKDSNNNISSFEIVNDNKISPLYIEWLDNKNLFVIIGSAHGTVAKGGNLYLLNVTTGKLSSVLQPSDKKQQIMTAQKSGSNVSLKVNVYEDDAYNKSHIENWTIYSFDASLSKVMNVKNSEGKLIYVINGANQ
ncbi:DUF4652 domain-containing protein [Clostridium magnum]|uniref:DUF4652 domain-containing protein n=1 Tax=Clostridium magnum DSM 2767 TaxID=1121326 RepID=A0A162TYR3_9CLOT|nr:DUF4652 domain-containing protein [Clostridium magnum]KZL93225.1 hypothetical protein CLMAG_02480 [Clostridium magnum DSM 2767]SHI19428.1 protein of unknown function [Clostridium magnum DSM 2767]